MSLKAFKESLQTCSAYRRATPPPERAPEGEIEPAPEAVAPRRPPRTSLRELFGAYGGSFLKPHLPSTDTPQSVSTQGSGGRVWDADPEEDDVKEDVAHVEDEDGHVRKRRRKVESGATVRVAEPDEFDAALVVEDVDRMRKRKRKVKSDVSLDVEPAIEDVQDSEAGLFIQSEKEGLYDCF